MRHNQFHLILMFFFTLILSCPMAAQSWNFIKEKDGIKIYTRVEAGKSLRSFKAVTDINAPAEKIFALMENIHNTDWWEKNLNLIKILLYEKSKRAQYYLVYDVPWPVTDRDLCVDVNITTDPVTGERKISSEALNGIIAEHADKVRIKDYRQTWTITPAGKEMTHIVLEGFIDPAGTVPNWLSDLLIIGTPFKAISGLREAMGKIKADTGHKTALSSEVK